MTDTAINQTRAVTEDLSLEEKASLTSGASFWRTKAVGSIPSIMLTDGPNGLRKQNEGGDHLGIGTSSPSTCFPPAVALGSSFDPELAARLGKAIGAEALIEGVSVVLGPGVNIKRSPLCGRNFEYFSEDPILSGVMGAAWVNGIQSLGVGAALKHFAANNQEHDRLRSSSDVDPRPLREIYLRAFQKVVQEAKPWTVMCSYNRINGVYASENRWLLTDVLRGEWGFDGAVVSDWGAVEDRAAGLIAGLDLEMPSTNGRSNAEIIAGVKDGTIPGGVLDLAAERVARLAQKANAAVAINPQLDIEAHHELAREAARRSIVLLQNDGDVLPVAKDTDLAVIGAFARTPRFQGAGSSLINPTRLDTALEEIRLQASGTVVYAEGYSLGNALDNESELREEAAAAAANSDVALLFLGLPDHLESEGYDRASIDLPADQLALLDAVVSANPRTVVVLSNGGVVALPFASHVPAILEAWLLGQGGGRATADVLFGAVNPSGKLTETIPVRLEDTPSFLNFPAEFGHVRYGEGLFVGYRWYDARQMDVAFPFGHGLSYTSFEYGKATATLGATGDIEVTFDLRNTGTRRGREAVQVYTSLPESAVQRPARELKAFASVELEAGENRTVTLTVPRGDLAYWDTRLDQWVVEGGIYTVDVAASSRDVRATLTIEIAADSVRIALQKSSTMGEALAHPVAGPALREIMSAGMPSSGDPMAALAHDPGALAMMKSIPLNRMGRMGGGGMTEEQLDHFIDAANRDSK